MPQKPGTYTIFSIQYYSLLDNGYVQADFYDKPYPDHKSAIQQALEAIYLAPTDSWVDCYLHYETMPF